MEGPLPLSGTQVGGPGAGAGQATKDFLGTCLQFPEPPAGGPRHRQSQLHGSNTGLHSQPNSETSGPKCSVGAGAQGLEREADMCPEHITSDL